MNSLSRNLILILLLAVYAISILYQCRSRGISTSDGTQVIRISHSRLEPGFADAMNAVIADFREYKARQGVSVDVQQIAVSNNYYEAWLNTQLVGGTAPDIAEQPPGKLQGYEVYYTTYFHILDSWIAQQNPFNDFEKIQSIIGDLDLNRNAPAAIVAEYPDLGEVFTVSQAIAGMDPTLRDIMRNQSHQATFVEGMRAGYNFETAHFYRINLSASQTRIIYNKNLFEAAQGHTNAPQTLEEFLALCEKLTQLRTPGNSPIVPIAATRETPQSVFHVGYLDSFTWSHSYQLSDHLLFGQRGSHYESYADGRWSMDSPSLRAFYEFAREMSRYMTPGYQSLDRASSMFDFIQQRAAMRITDIEEASSVLLQADFPMGIMSYPYPAPGDRWSEFAVYPLSMFSLASGQFSISRQSENTDLALEFLQFITSRIWNERFNRFANLIPVVQNAVASEPLRPYQELRTGTMGMPSKIMFRQSGHLAETIQSGEEWRYLSGEIDYDTFAERLHAAYNNPSHGVDRILATTWNNQWRRIKQVDRNTTLFNGRELLLAPENEVDRDPLYYMLFRSSIYNGGHHLRYTHDLRQWGEPAPKPFPTF